MVVHILEGVITSEYSGKTLTFMAGDTYIKPANENHTVKNLGMNDAKAILVSIGAEGLKVTIPVKDWLLVMQICYNHLMIIMLM